MPQPLPPRPPIVNHNLQSLPLFALCKAWPCFAARTVMALVGHGRPLAYDEADATGVALCHAFTWRG